MRRGGSVGDALPMGRATGAGAEPATLLHHGNIGAGEAEELTEHRGSRHISPADGAASGMSLDPSPGEASDTSIDSVVVPGYTLTDLVTLARSRVVGQRIIALQCLAKLLHRRRQLVTDRIRTDLGSAGGRGARTQGVIRPARLPRMLPIAIRMATSDDNVAALAAGFAAAVALVGTDDGDLDLQAGSVDRARPSTDDVLMSMGGRFYCECVSSRAPVLVPSMRAR